MQTCLWLWGHELIKAGLCCSQVDAEFAGSEALQPLPRLVYALLRSPLLTVLKQQHADVRTAICHLWASLPPQELRTAVYPLLTSFSNPDTLVSDTLPLASAW